ncbi:hypothetical protein CULT_60098 [[Clostridium] ultunense Esp]|nr:hypothetical protein CULT_60098 [[Clostridium] ultunense Esp]
MMKKRIPFFLALAVLSNAYLIFLILKPAWEQIRHQVEESGALFATVSEPLYHDYYFDYRYEGVREEEDWNVEVYREVKVLLDENGKKIAEIPTGKMEYIRIYRDSSISPPLS